MADETLSTELPYATTVENVAGKPTPVARWDVPEGIMAAVRSGFPAVVDMPRKSDGQDVARSTRFGFAYREPNDPLDAWTVVSDTPVAPFNALSLRDQQSGDNAERRRVNFDAERVPGGTLTLNDADELALIVNSPDVLDTDGLFFNYPLVTENV